MRILKKKKAAIHTLWSWGKGPAEQRGGGRHRAQSQLLSADGLLAKVSPWPVRLKGWEDYLPLTRGNGSHWEGVGTAGGWEQWDCGSVLQVHLAWGCTLFVFLEVKVVNGEGLHGHHCPHPTIDWDTVLITEVALSQLVEAGALSPTPEGIPGP